MAAYGSQAMSARLACVLMRRPGPSLVAADRKTWHHGPTCLTRPALRAA